MYFPTMHKFVRRLEKKLGREFTCSAGQEAARREEEAANMPQGTVPASVPCQGHLWWWGCADSRGSASSPCGSPRRAEGSQVSPSSAQAAAGCGAGQWDSLLHTRSSLFLGFGSHSWLLGAASPRVAAWKGDGTASCLGITSRYLPALLFWKRKTRCHFACIPAKPRCKLGEGNAPLSC